MRRAGVRILAAAAVVLLAAGGMWLSLTRVPQGHVGVIVPPREGEHPLDPGWRWHLPGSRIEILPAEAHRFSGTARIVTSEGASLEVPWEAAIDLGRGSPEGVFRIAVLLSEGLPLAGAVSRVVDEALGPAGGAGRGSEARSPMEAGAEAVAAALAPMGLVTGSLRLGSAQTASGPSRSHPLSGQYGGPPWPVLVIGIDSADWDLMGPMMDRGELPHLAGLRSQGAWGILRSMRPILSPILWTTLATGRPPDEHGILDFLVRDEATGQEVPISRLSRRVKAIWNIATDLGIPSATIGWWATWPAERVLGTMVTDRVAYSLFDLPVSGADPGAIHPPELLGEAAGLRLDESDVESEDIREIVPVDPARLDAAREALDTAEGYRDPVSHLIKVIASTTTYHRIARHVITTRRPALTLAYFEGLDEVNHRFAHHLPPAMPLIAGTDPALHQAYAQAVPAFYRLQDRLVGELREAAGPGAVTLIVSDHGFANGDERPQDVPPDIEARPGLWHTMDGVFLVAGPPVRPGRLSRPVELLDVLPTLLALMGLPQADDMPGRVIEEIFAPGARPAAPAVRLASYDQEGEPLSSVVSGAGREADREMMARLEALGYIGSGSTAGSAGSAAAAGAATATYHINAGQIFLENNELDRAEAEFRRARELAPRFDPPRLGLAQVSILRGRPEEALPLIEESLREGDPRPALFIRAARIYDRAARQRDGLRFLASLPADPRWDASRLCAMGLLHESVGELAQAKASFQKALASDPSLERALQGVYRLMRGTADREALAELLQKGRSAPRRNTRVRAANWLALTREAQGRREEARAILTEALREDPSDQMTLINLGSMLVREDRAAEAMPHLQKAREAHPRSHEVLVNLIVAHGKLGHLDEARAVFDEAQRAARPGDSAAQRHNALAFAAFLNGDPDLATRHIDASLSLEPDQPDARRLKAEIDRLKARPGGL